MSDLKPCPFCGSENVSHSVGRTGDDKPWPYVECENCGASTEPDVWNKRQDATIERLRVLLTRWVNIAENGHYGEHTKFPMKRHPIVAETLAALTAGKGGET